MRRLMNFVCGIRFRHGSRRVVLLLGKYALKFPKPTGIATFSLGVSENLIERSWWCMDYNVSKTWWAKDIPVPQVFYGSSNGLLVVMERCAEYAGDCPDLVHNTADNLEKYFRDVDRHSKNFGWDSSGRLVLLDFGFFGHQYLGQEARTTQDGYVRTLRFWYSVKCRIHKAIRSIKSKISKETL